MSPDASGERGRNTADYRERANVVLSDAAGTDRALHGDAMWALDVLREQGFVILTSNDTRAHQWRRNEELQAEVDRLNGRLARLGGGQIGRSVPPPTPPTSQGER